ncbi:MAG: endonuclease Q family protein [Candidatus Micrarchaeota archaeon]|nr:endonuclease Q family protein [Candidatus Micrarchaeota archaeon]
MQFIADFHIHSKYSRATSPSMDVESISKYAKIKGISLVGTGDFTHPLWLEELKQKLKPLGNGLFDYDGTLFMLTSEVNNFFHSGGKLKQVHNILFAPSFEVVEQINELIGRKGDLRSDGRPSLGMSAADLVELVMGVSKDCAIVPAHVWTPWRSIFGSASGFNSVEECFGDQSKHIFAFESGLSSDPKMNWMLSSLDKYALISNSDSHSPAKIGREANVFDLKEPTYLSLLEAIKKKDMEKFKMTVEFFPEEGKYHYDGHRIHNVRFSPEESIRNNNICPVCKRKLTIGVMHRVMELADRKYGYTPPNAVPFVHAIPLEELIASVRGKGVGSASVQTEYSSLISSFGTEFNVLLTAEMDELRRKAPADIADAILHVREGKVKILPGYDGVYGEIQLKEEAGQSNLSKFF